MTYNSHALFVLDPGLGSVIGFHANLGCIVSVAVVDDEIFVLRSNGARKILRLAQSPDKYPGDVL